VFISYAHDSDAHREKVRDLWVFLCANGVEAHIDRVADQERQDWTMWMERQVAEADHILIVASPAYKKRAGHDADPAEGQGVQYEARLIRNLFYANQSDLGRFLPVVLPGGSSDDVPAFLTPATTTVYQVSSFTVAGAEALLRVLHRRPSEIQPVPGPVPDLPVRSHTFSTTAAALHHHIDVQVVAGESGVTTTVLLGGERLGEPHTGRLPVGIERCWDNLDLVDTAVERLARVGVRLWESMVGEPTTRRLLELIDTSPVGTSVDLTFHLDAGVSWLPVELLRVPADQRLLATIGGVSLTRRLAGIDRPPVGRLPGPLKILAAVAAPEETKTGSGPVDVEAEMQALLDAVTDTAVSGRGQVRILEVASLPQITAALRNDQYHVLHLFAHGSPTGIELEDEDGNPVPASAEKLVDALRAGGHVLPLVVLSSCSGAAAGTAGVAAALVEHGADRVLAMHTTVSDTYATQLGRHLHQTLATDPDTTVAAAVATARRDLDQTLRDRAQASGIPLRPETAIPTLLAAGPDTPLVDTGAPSTPLKRPTEPPTTRGVRELPVGELIGRRAPLRTTMAVLRGTASDRARFGDWAGVALTGVGGIGKTALAGRILARARADGWTIVEHVGAWNPPALFTSLAAAIDDPDVAAQLRNPRIDDTGKLGYFLDLLGRERLLVLFDDFEQNLAPDTQEFTDPGFAELFPALLDAAGTGRIFTTCRYPIPRTGDALLRLNLPPLTPAEQRRLYLRLPALRDLSVQERRLVTRTIGGHPRLIEFLDVLLREGTPARFRHVARKLRQLAEHEDIDLTDARPLPDAVAEALRLGSRDILLETLLADLSADQKELLAQAALSRASLTLADLTFARHGDTPTADQARQTRRDVEHLTDLTLITPVGDGELLVHPWLAGTLTAGQSERDRTRRHETAAATHVHRVNTGRGRFDDLVEVSRHFAAASRYDESIGAALQACDLVGGEVAASALLADIVPLVPTHHPRFFDIADRECDALLAIGLASATASRYQAMLDAVRADAAKNPGHENEYLLAITLERLGNIAIATADTRAATNYFTESVEILDRLAATYPGNAKYQRAPSYSRGMLGDLAHAAGDSTSATQHYQASLAVCERLAAADPGNVRHQRDLSISRNKLGDLAVAAGDSTTAAQHYQASLAVRERLATTDPSNAQYQRDLSVSHERLGDLARAADDATRAAQHYQASLAVRERLAAADPRIAQYQRDLSISHGRLGDLARAADDATTAAQHYQAGLAIRERLAAADPGNAEYQRDLSISHDRLGDLARAGGDPTTATQHHQASLAIAEQLATTDPGNAEYQRDLAISRRKLAELENDLL
jgi:tetratricopeptide (TPR) repeat protein